MTRDSIEQILTAELASIAPDIDMKDVDRSQDLREEFDIDSIDFLNLVTALAKRFGLEMPEADYPQMDTFDHLCDYLVAKTG